MSVFGDGNTQEEPEKRECSFCGGRPSAYWTRPEIQICEKCAKKHLPKLMADAIVQDNPRAMNNSKSSFIDSFWKEAETVFYKAALFSALRGSRIKDSER